MTSPTSHHPIMNVDMPPAAAVVRTSDTADGNERWNAWRSEGIRADARMQRRANWFASALLVGSGLWVVFEILRAVPTVR